MENVPNCFQILGVQPGASPKALKKAYRDLVKTWHPDRFAGDPQKRQEAEEKLKDINLAFERIKDHRAILQALAAQKARAAPPPPKPRASPSPPPRPRPASAAKPRPTPAAPRAASTEKSSRQKSDAPARTRRSWKHFLLPKHLGGPMPVGLAATALVLAAALAPLFFPDNPAPRPPAPRAEKVVRLADVAIPRSTQVENATDRPPSEPGPSVPGVLPKLNSDAARTLWPVAPEPGELQNASSASASSPVSEGSARAPLISETLKAKLTTNQDDSGPPAPTPTESVQDRFLLALRYANGDGVPQDYAEAARLYRLAAEAGHGDAQRNLGFLYAAGKGVSQDYAEAERWFQKAGAQGNSGASFASAVVALSKPIGERRSAASENQATPDPASNSATRVSPLLARLKARLSEPSTNPAPVLNAEKERNPETEFALGLRYAKGEGVRQDYAEAAKRYQSAAEAGHPAAQKNLGYLYATGQGVPQDYSEAGKWFQQAAAQGMVGAVLARAADLRNASNSPAESSVNESGAKLRETQDHETPSAPKK